MESNERQSGARPLDVISTPCIKPVPSNKGGFSNHSEPKLRNDPGASDHTCAGRYVGCSKVVYSPVSSGGSFPYVGNSVTLLEDYVQTATVGVM